MSSVVVVGSFNVDHVWRCESLPAPGATIAGRYSTGPGGKGFNQAVASARAGARTHFVCALGDDAGGAMARGLAAQDGIALIAEASSEPTGTGGIYVDAHGRNTIVIGPGANAVLSENFIAGQQAPDRRRARVAGAVEIAGRDHRVGLAGLGPRSRRADRAQCRPGERAQLDRPAQAGRCAHPQRNRIRRPAQPPCRRAGQRRRRGRARRWQPACPVPQAFRRHRGGDAGLGRCVISHADEQLRGDSQAYYRVAAEPAQTIDTTGAGDAFNGALAASLAQMPAEPFIQHVRFATRFAARSTEVEGAAVSMPKLTPQT